MYDSGATLAPWRQCPRPQRQSAYTVAVCRRTALLSADAHLPTHGGLMPAALVAPACDGGDGLNGEGTIPQPPMVCMVRDGLRKRAVLI